MERKEALLREATESVPLLGSIQANQGAWIENQGHAFVPGEDFVSSWFRLLLFHLHISY